MYKSRFKVWGLAKNIVKEDASRIMMAAWSGERPDAPVIQGRKLGSKRFRKQLQTARELGVRTSPKSAEFYSTPPPTPVQYQQQMMMATRSSSPTSLSHRLWQPDVLGQSEQTIRAIHSYTDFCLETKVWELSSVEADHALNFPKGRSFKIFVVSSSMSTTSMCKYIFLSFRRLPFMSHYRLAKKKRRSYKTRGKWGFIVLHHTRWHPLFRI